jgi:hypothetical protein
MTTEINKIKTDSYDGVERVIVPPVDIHETENEFIIKGICRGLIKAMWKSRWKTAPLP